MLFDWWRKRRARTAPDPLGTYDRVLGELEQEGARVRRAAAALLALQRELRRSAERAAAHARELEARLDAAQRRGEEATAEVLRTDGVRSEEEGRAARAALARVDADAQVLVAAARSLEERVGVLRREREEAALRLRAGVLVQEALRLQGERFAHRVALEAARDEVERAHALAELYREEQTR
jgi:phage shock protein A